MAVAEANMVCVSVRYLSSEISTKLDIRHHYFLVKWFIESFEPLGSFEMIEMESGKLLLLKNSIKTGGCYLKLGYLSYPEHVGLYDLND